MVIAADFLPAIDTAEYQGFIDHKVVALSGVELAITKLHNTRVVDPMALRNVAGFEAAGMALSGYWYAHDTASNAVQRAADDEGWAKQLAPGNVFVMADVEGGENPPIPVSIDWWNSYMDALHDDTWLYGGKWYLGQFDQSIVRRHPVITAAYPRQGPNPTPPEWAGEVLALPQPQWPVDFQWAGHQFYSSGHVPGVPALCDLNIIRRSAVPTMPQGILMNTVGRLFKEKSKPAVYLGSTEGIVYRWVTGQPDLAWCQFHIHTNGGDPTITVVPDGALYLMGFLGGPLPENNV